MRVPRRSIQIGDLVEKALSKVGITSERVEKALGRPCGCKKRKEMLNQLGNWAQRILLGTSPQPEEELDKIIEVDET